MNPTNPVSIIKDDHENVREMFEEYKGMDYEDKKSQADKICENLAVHMSMEEENFYPEVEKISTEAEDMIADAQEEHDEIRSHMTDIMEADTEEDLDDHVGMMEEGFLHHIAEEEGGILPLAENNLKDDFIKMGAKMAGFKTSTKGRILLEKLKAKV